MSRIYFTLVLLALSPLSLKAVTPKAKLTICLTGTTVKTIVSYGEAFQNGATMAKLDLSKAYPNIEVQTKTFYYDRNPLAPISATKEMIKANCTAIVGYSTGNDLIAVSSLIQKSRIPVLSIYGNQSPSVQQVPHIMTMAPTPEYLVSALLGKLEDKIKTKKRFVVVTTVDRSAMQNYQIGFETALKAQGKEIVSIQLTEKNGDLRGFEHFVKERGTKEDSYILLTRAVIAGRISDFLYTHFGEENYPMVLGTPYFGSSALPAFLNMLEKKNVTAYISRGNSLSDKDPKFASFNTRYEEMFKKKPMVLSAGVYDAIAYFVKSISAQNLPGEIRAEDLLRAAKESSFVGITGITISPGFVLEHTKVFIIRITKEGYQSI